MTDNERLRLAEALDRNSAEEYVCWDNLDKARAQLRADDAEIASLRESVAALEACIESLQMALKLDRS